MNVWEKFKKLVEREGLVKPGSSVLAAVSGGPDSVCLLHLLWRYKKTVPFELSAVTVNHGLRREAGREIAKVEALCRRLNVPLIATEIPVREHARLQKLSTETSARILRYDIFTRSAQEIGADIVATGHTANDNAETIIMWLIRGTGAEGVSGIPLVRPLGRGLKVIRPILSSTRSEIMKYVKSQHIPYSIDKSNKSPEYTRNRIRGRVLPLLEKYNPRFVEHLFNFSQIMSRENEFMDEKTKAAVKNVTTRTAFKITLDFKRFFKYNKAIQLRLIKYILPQKRSAAQVEFLREWFLFSRGKILKFSQQWTVKRAKNKIIFTKS